MFRRIKTFFQAMKAVKAARAGGDVDAEIGKLLNAAGFDDETGEIPFESSVTELLLDPPFESLYPDESNLTKAHVALIRRMRMSWNGAESGAPQCEPLQSFAGGTAPELVRAELGDLSDQELAEFMISLVPAMYLFLDKATLKPGTYTLGNMDADLLAQSKQGLDNAEALFQISPEMSVTLDEEDILLVKETRWEWPDEGDMLGALENADIAGPTIDPKRPYGDMSYIDLDIHRALSWPVESRNEDGYIQISDAQSEDATRLHFKQLGAVQAFLEHAELDLDDL